MAEDRGSQSRQLCPKHTLHARGARRCCRFGKDFGGNYIVELVSAAPRVRIRSSRDRQQDQLADLAVLNERLAGDAGLVRPWEVHTLTLTGSLSARPCKDAPTAPTATRMEPLTAVGMF